MQPTCSKVSEAFFSLATCLSHCLSLPLHCWPLRQEWIQDLPKTVASAQHEPVLEVWGGASSVGQGVCPFPESESPLSIPFPIFRTSEWAKVKILSDNSPHVWGRLLLAAVTSPCFLSVGAGATAQSAHCWIHPYSQTQLAHRMTKHLLFMSILIIW